MSLAQYRLLREELTMAQRRELGQTIIPPEGGERVHGRVLAAEFLAEYGAILAEASELDRTVSPFRATYAEVRRLIDADLIEAAENLAYAVDAWQDDLKAERETRDWAVMKAAIAAESEAEEFELIL
ncbi:hypothetical protein [Mycolicibacterium houstonense]|uniref:hypothetical protein n=1 Tax=Mycolicibacterium houstonense TaxID=146021 RepID=UPI000836ADB1|nr:hypothetical protein [Mycolicibacterium houstonense]